MRNKDSNLKEKFRLALTSTAKVISDDLGLNNKTPFEKKSKNENVQRDVNSRTSPSNLFKQPSSKSKKPTASVKL